MQFDSIRHRLLGIAVLFLLSMGLMIYIQASNVNRLAQIHSHADTLTRLNADLLQLRRNEKDFLLRQELKYVDEFERQAVALRDRLQAIRGIDTEYQLDEKILQNLERGFADYRDTFGRLVALQQAIGLDETGGHQGRFHAAAHQLEQRLAAHGQDSLSLKLLQLRRYEKDFMLRHELQYEAFHARSYETLRGDLSAADTPFEADNLRLLDEYRSAFRQMVDTRLNMGLDAESGLQAEFSASAQAVELSLSDTITALAPLIAERQSRVRQSGMVIMVLTAVVLTAILLHSFLQLTRAFSTLIMFFYRCKRQFEMLDQRSVQFSEFRLLAEVVNEMVRAKQDAEFDLKEAQGQLAAYEAKENSERNDDKPASEDAEQAASTTSDSAERAAEGDRQSATPRPDPARAYPVRLEESGLADCKSGQYRYRPPQKTIPEVESRDEGNPEAASAASQPSVTEPAPATLPESRQADPESAADSQPEPPNKPEATHILFKRIVESEIIDIPTVYSPKVTSTSLDCEMSAAHVGQFDSLTSEGGGREIPAARESSSSEDGEEIAAPIDAPPGAGVAGDELTAAAEGGHSPRPDVESKVSDKGPDVDSANDDSFGADSSSKRGVNKRQ